MSQKERLLSIKSEYCLKTIFAYIDYNYILKLIKTSNQFQRKLGINIQNYKKKSSYQFVERRIISINDPYKFDKFEVISKYIFSLLITLIIFLFTLIYTIILFAKGGFNDNNTKSNYNIKYFNIIKKINLSLFGFIGYIIASYFTIFVWATYNCYIDYNKERVLKKFSLILTALIYLIYDACIIIKLYMSYKIKKNKITWFMICDYFLIIFIFLYLVFIIFIIYCYFYSAGQGIRIKNNIYILKKFQNIKIEDFRLPNDFKIKNDKEKRLYIFNKKNYYKILFSNNNTLELINEFRKKNNIDLLILETESFSDLIINKYSEIILFSYKTIYKLSKWEYLFVNQENEFKNKLKNEDKDLINILLIEDLNKIQIYKQDNNEFIYIYKKIESKNINHFENFLNDSSFRQQYSINNTFRDRLSRGGVDSYKDKYYGD